MKIIVTCGDCNGIGLEIFFKSVARINGDDFPNGIVPGMALCAEPGSVKNYLEKIKKYPGFEKIEAARDCVFVNEERIEIIDSGKPQEILFGSENGESGAAAAASVDMAAELAISGKYSAMVTMPISKTAVYAAGWKFPGHTEYIADKCGANRPMMILFHEGFRVALATIHMPLKEVSGRLTEELIKERAETLLYSLRTDFGIEDPKIAVLGLNPHAGEGGALGSEENETIIPAIQELQARAKVEGPFPADGFFALESYRQYGGILAMYHDQGLIPLKLSAKGNGVNFTAGLPIVRTSPGHGTAFDIAGKGVAGETSAYNSIAAAAWIAHNRIKTRQEAN